MFFTPTGEFQAVILNDTARPAATWGTSITPGASNVKGSYTEILAGASLSFDAYGIEVNLNSGDAVGNIRSTLVDIGIDYAATSSFSVLIPDLIGSCAANFSGNVSGVQAYYFPLFIKSGAQLGARAQVNNATAGSIRVAVKLFGKPKYPHLVRAGSYVTAFGITTASSDGTAVTPGTTSEGAWTDLSGADTTLPYWWWQFGFGVNNATINNRMYAAELSVGDGSNKQLVISDARVTTDNGERIAKWLSMEGMYEAPAGVRPYGRAQCSGTLDTGVSMAAYGVGGHGG